jgi:hypothetical protein
MQPAMPAAGLRSEAGSYHSVLLGSVRVTRPKPNKGNPHPNNTLPTNLSDPRKSGQCCRSVSTPR